MNKKEIQKTLKLAQTQIISTDEIINEVITLKEACGMLDVAESTLRTRVLKGEFEPWEYRKAGTIILFFKKAVEQRMNNFRIRQKSKCPDDKGGEIYECKGSKGKA